MAVFRPKVDELSLIRFNNVSLNNLNNQVSQQSYIWATKV